MLGATTDSPGHGIPPVPPHLEGLTSVEAAARLATHGPNELVPDVRRHGVLAVLWRAISEPMSLLLIVAAGAYFGLGDTIDAVAALVALAPIAAVSVILERRAERALDELAALTSPTATVFRDAGWVTVDARLLVPGDLIAVREGDVMAADGEIVGGRRIVVDESALTGESLPLEKGGEGDETAIWAGTTIRSGRSLARIVATGRTTRYGQIGTLVAESGNTRTPLERLVRRLVLRLGAAALVFTVVVAAIELSRGHGWGAAVIAGVSLGMAAIPEEFPLVFTIYLALGARRLATEHALVRRLTGVETLGSTTVICTDKTGTLTQGSLDVAHLVPLGHGHAGHDPGISLLEAAVLASEPEPFDPLDQAIVRHADAAGLDVAALHAGVMVRDHEFDPVHKYVTHVWQHGARTVVTAKGAVEGILAVAGATDDERSDAHAAMARLGASGMRVVAVAGGVLAGPGADRNEDERALHLLGLVGFADPTRPEVPRSIEECRSAGIRIVMITGDHPVTARAVAEGLGFSDDGRVMTGDEIDALDDAALNDTIGGVTVFARVRPEQKHRLVRSLRTRGEVVAMTGDGINDAPALREADIGVAMGERGTAVAREAATLVLLDDNFATIVGAVREGRRIFENLRHAFSYLVAFHIPLLLLALVVPLAGHPLLLLPFHLIVLEFLLHPIVALVFEQDPAPPGVMESSPRHPGTGLLDRRLILPVLRGLALAGAVGAVYLAASGDSDAARGRALAALFLGELFLVVVERSGPRPLWERAGGPNRILLPVLGAGLAVVGVLFLFPPARELMGVSGLTGTDWWAAVGLAAAGTLWTEPIKAFRIRAETARQ